MKVVLDTAPSTVETLTKARFHNLLKKNKDINYLSGNLPDPTSVRDKLIALTALEEKEDNNQSIIQKYYSDPTLDSAVFKRLNRAS